MLLADSKLQQSHCRISAKTTSAFTVNGPWNGREDAERREEEQEGTAAWAMGENAPSTDFYVHHMNGGSRSSSILTAVRRKRTPLLVVCCLLASLPRHRTSERGQRALLKVVGVQSLVSWPAVFCESCWPCTRRFVWKLVEHKANNNINAKHWHDWWWWWWWWSWWNKSGVCHYSVCVFCVNIVQSTTRPVSARRPLSWANSFVCMDLISHWCG